MAAKKVFDCPVGARFGSLTVLGNAARHRYWVCACICGRVKEFVRYNVRNGGAKSCGCKQGKQAATVKYVSDGSNKEIMARLREDIKNGDPLLWKFRLECLKKLGINATRLEL